MYADAGNGLKVMFAGEIIGIIAGVLTAFGMKVIGPVVGVAGTVVVIMGLLQASKDNDAYKTAMVFAALGAIVSFFSKGTGFFHTLMNIANSVLNMLVVYIVCTTTAKLLAEAGFDALADNGKRIWTVYLTCTIIIVICALFAVVPLLNILAGIAAIITGLVAFVIAIMYLIFLNKSGNALSAS